MSTTAQELIDCLDFLLFDFESNKLIVSEVDFAIHFRDFHAPKIRELLHRSTGEWPNNTCREWEE